MDWSTNTWRRSDFPQFAHVRPELGSVSVFTIAKYTLVVFFNGSYRKYTDMCALGFQMNSVEFIGGGSSQSFASFANDGKANSKFDLTATEHVLHHEKVDTCARPLFPVNIGQDKFPISPAGTVTQVIPQFQNGEPGFFAGGQASKKKATLERVFSNYDQWTNSNVNKIIFTPSYTTDDWQAGKPIDFSHRTKFGIKTELYMFDTFFGTYMGKHGEQIDIRSGVVEIRLTEKGYPRLYKLFYGSLRGIIPKIYTAGVNLKTDRLELDVFKSESRAAEARLKIDGTVKDFLALKRTGKIRGSKIQTDFPSTYEPKCIDCVGGCPVLATAQGSHAYEACMSNDFFGNLRHDYVSHYEDRSGCNAHTPHCATMNISTCDIGLSKSKTNPILCGSGWDPRRRSQYDQPIVQCEWNANHIDTHEQYKALMNFEAHSDAWDFAHEQFCSEVTDKCMTNPITGKPPSRCSRLRQEGEDGDKCRQWLAESLDKRRMMHRKICDLNDLEECRCVNRSQDPLYKKVVSDLTFRSEIGNTAANQDSCWYIPCKNPNFFHVDDDLHKPECANHCQSIVKIKDVDTGVVDFSSVINCDFSTNVVQNEDTVKKNPTCARKELFNPQHRIALALCIPAVFVLLLLAVAYFKLL